MWKSTQSPQPMHALSTQRKANTSNDVSHFPSQGETGVQEAVAPFSTYSWQNGTLMTVNSWVKHKRFEETHRTLVKDYNKCVVRQNAWRVNLETAEGLFQRI